MIKNMVFIINNPLSRCITLKNNLLVKRPKVHDNNNLDLFAVETNIT